MREKIEVVAMLSDKSSSRITLSHESRLGNGIKEGILSGLLLLSFRCKRSNLWFVQPSHYMMFTLCIFPTPCCGRTFMADFYQ